MEKGQYTNNELTDGFIMVFDMWQLTHASMKDGNVGVIQRYSMADKSFNFQ